MSANREYLNEAISALKQQRDQIALKIHLGAAEAKEEWDRLTAQLDQLTDEFEPLKEASQESAENVYESLKLVAGEVKEGFSRIWKSL